MQNYPLTVSDDRDLNKAEEDDKDKPLSQIQKTKHLKGKKLVLVKCRRGGFFWIREGRHRESVDNTKRFKTQVINRESLLTRQFRENQSQR